MLCAACLWNYPYLITRLLYVLSTLLITGCGMSPASLYCIALLYPFPSPPHIPSWYHHDVLYVVLLHSTILSIPFCNTHISFSLPSTHRLTQRASTSISQSTSLVYSLLTQTVLHVRSSLFRIHTPFSYTHNYLYYIHMLYDSLITTA